MRISEREHTFESFITELVESGLEFGERLRIVCYFVHETEWGAESPAGPSLENLLESNGVNVKKLGDIRKLVAHYRDAVTSQLVPVSYFAYLHRETRLLMCFTSAAGRDVYQTLDKIVERNPGLYYAFIGPSTLIKIETMLVSAHPGTVVTYFSARRNRQSSLRSEIRPEYERTIEYHGHDGKNVLEELRHAYGVAPRSMHFEIPDFATYHVHNGGQLAIVKGESNARKYLLEIADFAMKDILLARRAVESADFKLIPVETERKILLFPKLKPWRIRFGESLKIKEGENLVEILKDSQFDIFNHVLAEGSLRLSGMVSDRLKNTIFTVDANSERMVVAPIQEASFDSFLRFYQVIVENFDPNAVCEVFE